jgi:hypothetical protein
MLLSSKALFLITFAFGVLLGLRLHPDPELPGVTVTQTQGQSTNCKAIVSKKTHPDGSVDEVFEFLATNKQDQQQKAKTTPANQANNALFLGLGLKNDFKAMAAAQLILSSSSIEIISDLKKDHSIFYKKEILRF